MTRRARTDVDDIVDGMLGDVGQIFDIHLALRPGDRSPDGLGPWKAWCMHGLSVLTSWGRTPRAALMRMGEMAADVHAGRADVLGDVDLMRRALRLGEEPAPYRLGVLPGGSDIDREAKVP